LGKEKRDVKKKIEIIEVHRERDDRRKCYQILNRFGKVFQPRLNACKNNSGKLIEEDDKILEHCVTYFTTRFEKENSEKEESDEEVF
jgi:hypothetical protein